MDEITELRQRISQLEQLFNKNNFPQKQVFEKSVEFIGGITIKGGKAINVDTVTGASIGTTNSKLSVYGVTPVVQANGISTPSGGATVDSQSRTAIGSIITALKNFGITL